MDEYEFEEPEIEPEDIAGRLPEEEGEDQAGATDALLFLRALRVAFGRIPLWGMVTLALLLLSLPVWLPWQSWFASTTAHAYEPGTLVHNLDETFRFDQRAGLASLNAATARTGAGLMLIAGLLGLFAAGGWLQVTLERTHGHSLRSFFFGGSRYFFRFARFWVLVLLILAGVHWTLYDWPWDKFVLDQLFQVPASDYNSLETLGSEETMHRLNWLRDGIAAVAFFGIMMWGTLARTRMALNDSSSALWAGFMTFFFMLRHPFKTVRPLLALYLVELLLVTLVAGGITRWLNGELRTSAEWMTLLLLFGVSLLTLMWREITRGARYFAAVQVCKEFRRRSSRPDPWNAIGGPGGPQYPVDDGADEYGVAM